MMLGGLYWIVKAGVIILTDDQPPYLFEIAPLLFAIGLVGLYVQLLPSAGWVGRAGVVGTGLGFVSQIAALVYERLPDARISGAEDFVFPYSMFVLIGSLGILIGLLLLGVETLRVGGLPAPWHRLPIVVIILAIIFSVTVVFHLELPILLIGCLWMFLGNKLWQNAKASLIARTE